MTPQGSRRSTAWRWEMPTLWLGILVVFTTMALAHTFMSVFSVASCTETSCDYEAFTAAINTSYIGSITLLIVTVIAMILLRKHPRAAVWAPITAILLLTLLHVLTYVAGRAALTLPLLGNRLPGCC
ncbi:hypothetical protein [Microbacterium sp. NPDC056234]|uniref:hypothetical protein n=1 Tax=Microbacterium sp. NPDC056234 TaxID=3345757 RepID=UPI0035E1E59E